MKTNYSLAYLMWLNNLNNLNNLLFLCGCRDLIEPADLRATAYFQQHETPGHAAGCFVNPPPSYGQKTH